MKFPTFTFLFHILLVLPHATCFPWHRNETDQMALLDFKLSCSDPHGSLASWNASSHFCSWKGVSCSRKHPQRVIRLDLTDQQLMGYISPSLGNLTHLRALLLSNNSFSGEIPSSFGHLQRLKVISLSNNSLQGWIPHELCNCSNLQILSLLSNHLKGRIPYNIGSLLNLVILNLSANNLTGSIPSSIGNMTALNVLSLTENYLQESIPEELGRLLELSYLGLGANLLSGSVPLTLFNLSSVIYLGLELNHLKKAVLPLDFGKHIPNIQHLGLDSNNFEGPIPASIANASKLVDLGLSSNYFSGRVPSSIGNLHDLTFLNLESNSIEASDRESWEFINSLANCSNLQTVALAMNNLGGYVPSSIGNLSSEHRILYLGTNQLSGVFPSSIANLQNLIALSLENNQYVGSIPELVGKLGNLQALYLEGNGFTGHIPFSIGNLSQLSYLYLQDNNIEGLLPQSIGNMKNLLRLNITNNSLQGSVPAQIFSLPSLISCQLSFNKLDGILPHEVGNAKQLMELELSSNKLSGGIPHTLGNCQGLGTIDLAQNNLTGEIPLTLGNLESLKILNLSHNNLSGTIPKSLGALKLLNQLDVSYNHLVGEVPTKGVFLNASAIMFEGNSGLCGGVSELHIPACSVPSSGSLRRKSSRVRTVAAVVSTVICLLVILIILCFLYRKKKMKQEPLILPSFGAKFPTVTYKDLDEATDRFSPSNLIGRGRYGSVYKARLHGQTNYVAVKVFDMETRGANRSFIAECEALRSIRHRNLVPILTACSSIDSGGNDFKALVYEFMPNGSLDSLLHPMEEGSYGPCYLTLTQRLSIALDIGNALEYLHYSSQRPIVHSDLKPSNILLDNDMTAHISDFGLARFFDDNVRTASTTAVKGTIGYIAPEYASGGQVMASGDVYAFGIILLEMFTGRRPTDDMFKDEMSIVSFVEASFPDRISEIIDACLLEEIDDFEAHKESTVTVMECVRSVLMVGLSCTCQSPKERMSMREVAPKLQAIRGVA